MGKPAATLTHFHICPKTEHGPVPHVGGPIIMGSPNVLIGGLPAARKGDKLVCVGPPDTINEGSSNVFINGKLAARQGDGTAHGGSIVIGNPTVLIGEDAPAPTVDTSLTTERNMHNVGERKALLAKHDFPVGPYKELKKIKKPGYQREHPIPHSCLTDRPKQPNERRNQVPIGPEFGNYNEGDAITYFVYDGQSPGTEHRHLTDIERTFAKSLEEQGKHATLKEWLDHMEQQMALAFTQDSIERAPDYYAPRVPPEDAPDVAKAIRIECEEYFKKAGVPLDAKLANHIAGGSKAEPDRPDKPEEQF